MEALLPPSLVSNIRRVGWVTHKDSAYFLLQSHEPRGTKPQPVYRIISRSFPQYKRKYQAERLTAELANLLFSAQAVAAHDNFDAIVVAWAFIHETVLDEIEGKITSKKIVKFLKNMIPRPKVRLGFPTFGVEYSRRRCHTHSSDQ